MDIRSVQKLVGLLFLCLIGAGACKKSGSSSTGGSPGGNSSGGFTDSLAPAVTPVGSPVGTPVSKTIGAAGGTLVSADGVVELVIPAGALSANTNISIQPVTNTMPDSAGLGLAYDMLPNGTKFNVPITIIFHYTPDEVPDNDADFLTIAYQDSSGAWQGDLQNRDFDTTAKTVSLDVSHFTIFGLDDGFRVNASRPVLTSGQVSYLVAYENTLQTGGITGRDIIPANVLGTWTVNGIDWGNKQVGTIAASSFNAFTYTAPPVTQITTFSIAVTFHIHEVVYKKNKKVAEYSDFVRAVNITVYPLEYNFTVTLIWKDSLSVCGELYGLIPNSQLPVYIDQVTFDLDIKSTTSGLQATTGVFHNQAPTVSPANAVWGNFFYEWIPDDLGVVNISAAVMDVYPQMPIDSIVNFTLTNNGINVGRKITDNSTGTVTTVAPKPCDASAPCQLNYFLLDLTRVPPYTDGFGAGAVLYTSVVQKQ